VAISKKKIKKERKEKKQRDGLENETIKIGQLRKFFL
jgi:hypothetical protein